MCNDGLQKLEKNDWQFTIKILERILDSVKELNANLNDVSVPRKQSLTSS